jgi:hypothetical protein
MQLQVQRSVDPGDPDQGEDDGELGQPADRDMLGQVVGRLADDGHIDQVVEQLQGADLPVGDDVAVGSWRLPEPPLEAAMGLAGHDSSRPPRPTSRMLGDDLGPTSAPPTRSCSPPVPGPGAGQRASGRSTTARPSGRWKRPATWASRPRQRPRPGQPRLRRPRRRPPRRRCPRAARVPAGAEHDQGRVRAVRGRRPDARGHPLPLATETASGRATCIRQSRPRSLRGSGRRSSVRAGGRAGPGWGGGRRGGR